jgi:outer membrane receptor protein involved in Fe transport
MRKVSSLFLGFVVLAAVAVTPAIAWQDGAQDSGSDASDQPMDEVQDVMVVTASRTEQPLHEVPAAMTVLTAEDLAEIPADDYGDYLRNVPGLNVSQMSARDIQISGRTATSSLATSELVLLDNRTLYLDFFGFVMWDFVPLDPKEIKQIEVVRGPGSAVWGANAMSGVINLITKSPREMQGTTITLGAGELGTASASITHAGATEKMGYKLSGSYLEQDPYDRPTGTIPGTTTPYPAFENQGTTQPKLNARLDFDADPSTVWSFSGGYAGTDGIIHSGIGPFDIDSGSRMNFVKADWTHLATSVTFFVNLLDGSATNLLTVGPTGQPLEFDFQSDTYNIDIKDTRVAGENHILTYGATARRNNFDLSIAPAGDKRDEYGAFLQDEILFGNKARWLIGARFDNIDPIGSVFSPRTSFLYSASPNHTFRASYNRAFRAPSMINNYLDITIVNLAQLPPLPQLGLPNGYTLIFPSQAIGNPGLTEERVDAYEVGYVGTFGRTTFTASVYRNKLTDSTDFFTSAVYTAANPLPGWPLPSFVLDLPEFAGQFPAQFSFRNIGEIVDQGVELSLEGRPVEDWSWFANYSYQDDSDISGIDKVRFPDGSLDYAVNKVPTNRYNLGLSFDNGQYFVNTNVNHADDAFWTDVLDSRFWGPTDAYTQLNVGFGMRFSEDKVTASINVQNVFDEDVQQHVFGDIIGRKATGQVVFRF